MSEPQFQEIRSRLGGLEDCVGKLTADVDILKTDVAVLKTDVAVLKTDVAVLKTDVAVLKTDVAVLKTDVAVLKTDVREIKEDARDLRRHMGVLHEEVLDRIKGIGENDALRQEMRAGFAELRQVILDHTIPGEAADRRFATTLNDHEQRLQVLEQRR